MDYTPNSHRSKETQKPVPAEKKIQKVVSGQVKTKKKSEFNKLADIFLPEDVSDVKSYILMDVLIPAAKKLIDDVVTGGIHMWLYGSSGRGKSNSSSGVSYVSYRNYSDSGSSRPRASESRNRYSCDDIVLESRGDAELVISQMDELMELYGQVSVADLYDLVGKTGDYTDNRYGWVNIKNAEPVRVRDGWMIKMPRAIPIK